MTGIFFDCLFFILFGAIFSYKKLARNAETERNTRAVVAWKLVAAPESGTLVPMSGAPVSSAGDGNGFFANRTPLAENASDVNNVTTCESV